MGLLDYYKQVDGAELHEEVAEINCLGFEMGLLDSNTFGVEIPVNTKLVKKIKEKDADARFVVIELESGFSKSKRNWKPEHLKKIERWVNSVNPVAYKGHISEQEDSTAFPPIHAVWVGAKTIDIAPDKCKLYLKGYLKTDEIRDEIDLEMVDAVSPRGDIRMRLAKTGGYDVIDFDPESIDFTRKSRNGLPSRVVSVGGEQTTKEGQVDGKDIALLSEPELKQYAPLLFEKIQRDARGELETKVGEMTTQVETLEPQAAILEELKKLLKLEDGANIVEKVTALISKVESLSTQAVRDFVKEIVGKKIPKSELAQRIISRAVGEQIDRTPFDFSELTDDVKKKVGEMIDAEIEKDADIKELKVTGGEQTTRTDATGGASFAGRDRSGSQSRTGDPAVVTDNDNIRVRKVKVR
jgi:hypothetical protein